jgi:copper chaperone CopZ
MKPLIIIALALVQSRALAADPVFEYSGQVAGVVCQVCSGKVKHLLEALPGVKNVKLKSSKTPGVAIIELESTSPELSKETATKALGKESTSYVITSFKRVDP